MHPYLVRFEHPLTGAPAGITTYSALMFLGAALAILLIMGLGRRRGLSSFDLFAASSIAFGAGLVGARFLFLVVHGREVIAHGGWTALFASGGGLVWYGGALFGAAGFIAYAKGYGLPLARMLDVAAPGAALGQAFGRLGCFTAGCCHGGPAGPGAPAVVFPEGSLAPAGIALVPVQLYEAGLLLLLALVLTAVLWRRQSFVPAGSVAIGYLTGYASLRIFTETLRGDPRGPQLAGLSLSQALSLVLLVTAAILVRQMLKRPSAPTPGS